VRGGRGAETGIKIDRGVTRGSFLIGLKTLFIDLVLRTVYCRALISERERIYSDEMK